MFMLNILFESESESANLTVVRSPGHNTCIDYVISLILYLLYLIDIHVHVYVEYII